MRFTALVSLALALAASSMPLSSRGTSPLQGDITDTAAQAGGKVDSATNPVTHNAFLRLRTTSSITQTGDGIISKAKGAASNGGSGAADSLAGTTVGQASGNSGITQAGGSIVSDAKGAAKDAGAGAVSPPTTSIAGASA